MRCNFYAMFIILPNSVISIIPNSIKFMHYLSDRQVGSEQRTTHLQSNAFYIRHEQDDERVRP